MSFRICAWRASRRVVCALGAVVLVSGCATRLPAPITGYTCCNLRPSYAWIGSNNVLGGAMLPAGQRASFDTVKGRYYIYGRIGTEYVSLSHDTARSPEDTLRWVHRLVVPDDPAVRLASWPQEVQNAVRAARVLPGMSREQVLMALAYPSPADTPDLGASTWRYWITVQDDETVDIRFDAEGRVQGLSGKPEAVRALEFRR